MNEERMKEIFSDEAFLAQLFAQEEPEQVQALLVENEMDISVDEICKLKELIEKHMNGEVNLEELSDDDLENVSGGAVLTILAVAAGIATITGSALLLTGAWVHNVTRTRW